MITKEELEKVTGQSFTNDDLTDDWDMETKKNWEEKLKSQGTAQ